MTPYETAKKYYPRLWDIDRIKALLAAGKITQAEYEKIINREDEP